jgi:HSP20 family molecular chaperone IbpA
MSLYRTFASLRGAHSLRPRVNTMFSLFERDPFFAKMIPMLNNEIVQFQGYTPRVQTFEGPKSYRIDAEVPGFRKEELSIEFPKKGFIRIAGKRRLGGPELAEVENVASEYNSTEYAAPVESQATSSTEAAKNVEPVATSKSAVSGTESKEVKPSEVEEEFQVVGTGRDQEITFSDQWSLPEDVDIDAVKAKLDHGILSVFLPKKAEVEVERKVLIE